MKSFQVFTMIVLSSAMVVACSGNSRAKGGVRQCPAGHDPISKTLLKGQEKVWEKAGDQSTIPAGTYTLERADFHYVDASGFTIQTFEAKDRAGVFQKGIYCARGVSKVDISKLPGVLAQGVSKMSLSNNVIETRTLGFEVVGGKILAKAEVGAPVDSLSKAYEIKGTENYFLMKTSETDYQIRSFYEDAHGRYSLSMQFKKQ